MKYYPVRLEVGPNLVSALCFRDLEALSKVFCEIYVLPDIFHELEFLVGQLRVMLLAAFEKNPKLKDIQPPPLENGDIVLCLEEDGDEEYSKLEFKDSDWERNYRFPDEAYDFPDSDWEINCYSLSS